MCNQLYREFEAIITEHKDRKYANVRKGWEGHASQSHTHFTKREERDKD